MQTSKEGVESKSRKAIYYSLILANQLGGERRTEIAKAADKIDPGSQIQLTLALRQMRDAYDNSPKPMVRRMLQPLWSFADPPIG